MDERVQFIGELGKQILFVDCSHCSAREVEAIARKVPDVVTVQPRNSVLLLVDFTGASFDREAIRTMLGHTPLPDAISSLLCFHGQAGNWQPTPSEPER